MAQEEKKFSPHLAAAHTRWKEWLRPDDCAVDMTCGNGRDTATLARLLPFGVVYGFDVQPEAIAATRKRVLFHPNVCLELRNHAAIHSSLFCKPPRLVVYNLGYLPGGDKKVVTQVATTLESLQRALDCIFPQGACSVMCYPGHEEGAREEAALIEFCSQLNPERWRVTHTRWSDRQRAPSWIWMVPIPSLYQFSESINRYAKGL
jgi:SAM-dependent methyltransferase